MTTWNEYVEGSGTVPEWSYPIRYEEETEIVADVLVAGGGVAGCHAAISAARQGARVVLTESGH
ncbi:MAG: FAD-dependent oxidoreductase, partial [Syntrophorhabdales bacterium]